MAYDNFAYKHSVIGSMEDLNAATVDDVASFFRTYYSPNNAVVALVGDLDTKTTLAKVEKYFGSIPRQPSPKPVDLSEPEMKGERRDSMEDKLARLAQINMGYKTPAATNPDSPALSALAQIFGGGESSRPQTALSNATQIKEYGLPADYWDTYPEKIAAVTAADVQRVARKYIPLDNIAIVAVGDAAKIRSVLAEFGTVEDWDAEGRRVR
ncbi:MAG TPA: insulinase family protein [Vicinamibacterales bacterium]|nr:insulinase family protein [Vicinamibacterales bacterium]